MIGLIYFFNLNFGFFHLCIYQYDHYDQHSAKKMKNLQTMMKLVLSNQQDSGRNFVLIRIRCQKLKIIVTLKVQQRRQHRKNIQHSSIWVAYLLISLLTFQGNMLRKMLISVKIPSFLLYNCCPLFQNPLCV